MKKVLFAFIALLHTLACCSQTAEHVVIITIDGFRPDFYLDPSWNAVNLRQLMLEGVHAPGVNSVFEPNGPTGKIYWKDSSIKMPTFWSVAQAKGLKVSTLFWPVSAEAPVR